ncbi:MAG: hypothetical protein LUQ15_06895 [Methanothrix sp.]|nr:hypothetical protein [Methanothrix sp.]
MLASARVHCPLGTDGADLKFTYRAAADRAITMRGQDNNTVTKGEQFSMKAVEEFPGHHRCFVGAGSLWTSSGL